MSFYQELCFLLLVYFSLFLVCRSAFKHYSEGDKNACQLAVQYSVCVYICAYNSQQIHMQTNVHICNIEEWEWFRETDGEQNIYREQNREEYKKMYIKDKCSDDYVNCCFWGMCDDILIHVLSVNAWTSYKWQMW